MPGEYYLGLAAPAGALLMCTGLSRRSAVLVGAVLVLACVTTQPTQLKQYTYRADLERVRSQCHNCVVVVNAGCRRGTPGSVLLEAQPLGLNVLVLNEQSHGWILQQLEHYDELYFVRTFDGCGQDIQQTFLQEFPGEWQKGFYKTSLRRQTASLASGANVNHELRSAPQP